MPIHKTVMCTFSFFLIAVDFVAICSETKAYRKNMEIVLFTIL